MKRNNFILVTILAALAISGRLLPHPANFTPVAAVALFAGYYLPKKSALILPLLIMLISDFFIGFYEWQLMVVVYSCFSLTALIGLLIRKIKQPFAVITATLTSSLLFFLITNLAVWLFSSWYPHNFQGLMLNYTLAIPFFKNTVFGDLFYVGILFGSYELIKVVLQTRLAKIKHQL